MLHNIKFMEQFTGYTQWPEELKYVARERLLYQYIEEDQIVSTSHKDYVQQLQTIIKEDIEFYERFEEYEICQLLKDLQEDL